MLPANLRFLLAAAAAAAAAAAFVVSALAALVLVVVCNKCRRALRLALRRSLEQASRCLGRVEAQPLGGAFRGGANCGAARGGGGGGDRGAPKRVRRQQTGVCADARALCLR